MRLMDVRAGRLEWLAVAVIVAFSFVADGLGPDDTLHFNYINNVVDASPIVSTQGYLHILPGLSIAMLAPLPFAAQALGYRLLAVLGVLLLHRELRRLFHLAGGDRQAILLALAVVLTLTGLDPSLLGYVTWINWTMCLAAVTCLFRADASDTPLTALGFAGVAAGLVTTPVGVLAVPICTVQAWSARERRRRQLIALAIVVTAWHLLQLLAAEPSTTTLEDAVAKLREHLDNAVPIVVVALLTCTALAATARGQRERWRARADLTRLYLAAASTLGFVLSPRLLEQGYEARYLLVPVYCAAVGVAARVTGAPVGVRTGLVAACAVLGLVWPVQVANAERRGPAVLWLQKMDFLQAAAGFRGNCRDDQVMVFEDETPSPVVLCRPRSLAPGLHYLENFTPWVGAYDPDAELDRHAYIEVFEGPVTTLRRAATRLTGR